ncbi:ataxin-10 [Anopheles stephensi]|uniref:Ataxin-10 n=1 Tax=Anopheles stephensi TaxID=30069 RepID=A0A182XWR0_ANOST|nr:ataxin-10 [Anopheles stephensi]XP_035895352.1 ataxin-10 [Anopheles stephensi]
MIDIKQNITDKNYNKVLDALNSLNISDAEIDTFRREVSTIIESFYACHESEDEVVNRVAIKCLNLLKRACARGESFQNAIVARVEFLERVRDMLVNEKGTVPLNVRNNCLQLLANLCVQNTCNQERIITFMHTFLHTSVSSNGGYANAAAMILYNGFIYKTVSLELADILNRLLDNVEANRLAQTEVPEFVCIFLEYLIAESNEMVQVLETMDASKRMLLFRYLIEYIRQDDRRIHPIHPDVFKHLLAEFKKKSDMILKTDNVQLDAQDTEEAFTLLVLLADATCVEPYGSFLRHDGGLFLNFGCLLRQMQLLGKSETKNMFTPVQKIEEILKIKQGDSELDIETQISYSLRSAVVKALANLSYKSKKNQKLAREMDIMAAILECTNLDARNPLIKEWSILAIRNLCDDNPENQQFIAGLKKLGDAENALITEYKSGTIRISENARGKK